MFRGIFPLRYFFLVGELKFSENYFSSDIDVGSMFFLFNSCLYYCLTDFT